MVYSINDCPIGKEVWFAGIRYDERVRWLDTDKVPKPVFNLHPVKGKVIVFKDVVEFQYECIDRVYSVNLTYMDMLCYVLADTPEEAAQGYNNLIYQYSYKLNQMLRDFNLYRIKNIEGVF